MNNRRGVGSLTGLADRVRLGEALSPVPGRTESRRHSLMTAAIIDSRHDISARRRAETEIHLPQGTRVAFTGTRSIRTSR